MSSQLSHYKVEMIFLVSEWDVADGLLSFSIHSISVLVHFSASLQSVLMWIISMNVFDGLWPLGLLDWD